MPPPNDYPHLEFVRCWKIEGDLAMNLGRCDAFIQAISALPIPPEAQIHLKQVAFRRGAQATTAIEGNTLTNEEFEKLQQGVPLPKSREYQGREVGNVLGAMNEIAQNLLQKNQLHLVTPKMLCEWNKKIGAELGPLYDGVPGRYRKDRRHVGTYLAPPPEAVSELVSEFCDWLRSEFKFGKAPQDVATAIQQAIAAHVFFEWIHPFADGNGRTGRLLEFYILLRAGFPDLTVHVLANHYNNSRSEYAANFDAARKRRSLTKFMEYAVQGLTDGLSETLAIVQGEACKTAWESHVYRTFASYTDYNKRSVFKRRRSLALAMPVDAPFSIFDLVRSTDDLAIEYLNHDHRMLSNDVQVLLNLHLMTVSRKDDVALKSIYKANIEPMLASNLARRVNSTGTEAIV